jgi:uncharacterized SAM-binding protein YcdF (DUF218 family)
MIRKAEEKVKKRFFQIVVSALVFAITLAAFWIGGIILSASASDTPAFDRPPDYLLILGCRLEGEEPGACLTERIEAAVEYLEEHPACIAVASGGQGADEVISEAEAISRALQNQGIVKERIIKEEQSTSTYENFLFSKQFLDDYEEENPYYIAFVTNDFHVYRARKLAAKAGFETPVAVSASSSAFTFYPNFLREIIAVPASWLKDR